MRKIPNFFHEVQGRVPEPVDFATYRLRVEGAVARPLVASLDELAALLPAVETDRRFFCVNGWSLQQLWGGYRLADLLEAVGADPGTPYLRATSVFGYEDTTSIADLLDGEAMLVTHMNGEPLAPERGRPMRVMTFNMYQFKAVKALGRIEIVSDYRPGTWEKVGYQDATVQPYPHLSIDGDEELMPDPQVLEAFYRKSREIDG